jgi:hypothetical protein
MSEPQIETRELDVARRERAEAPQSVWVGRGMMVGWILAAAPGAFTTFLILHAAHVRLYLGRWPVVYRDNPSTLLLRLHEYGLLAPSFYFALFGVPLWFLLSVVLAFGGGRPRRAVVRQALLIAAALSVLFLVGKLDPTGYIEWFLD